MPLSLDFRQPLSHADNHAESLVKKYTRLSRAEAHCIATLLDRENPQRRCELFGEQDSTEFIVTQEGYDSNGKSSMTADAVPPENIIGLYEQFFLEDSMRSRAKGMSRCYFENRWEQYRQFFANTIYCFPGCVFQRVPNFYTDEKKWRYTRDGIYHDCQHSYCVPFKDFPRTEEKIIFPLLGFLAIRYSALYSRIVTVEEVCDMIFANEFLPEPCWDLKEGDDAQGRKKLVVLDNLPKSVFARTLPVKSHKQRYNMHDAGILDPSFDFCDDDCASPAGAVGYPTISNKEGTLHIPFSYYSYGETSTPVTFPISPTTHFPLYQYDLIADSKEIYLCEYPRFAGANLSSAIPVIGTVNGEWGLQFTDFDPLEGKEVRYLEMQSANDQGPERAHRVMLKAFAMAQKAGNRNFTALCIESGTKTRYKDLLMEAIEHGYLKDAGSLDVGRSFESCLPWGLATGKKETIFGRAIQAGRVNIFSAPRGTGKTELMLMLAVLGAHGASLDHSFLEYKLSKPCKTLYIQSEMDAEEDLRKGRVDGLEDYISKAVKGSSMGTAAADNIFFYAKKESLVNVKEQCDILKELARLDPEHQCQWRVVIDSIKTEMPEAQRAPEVYSQQVFPWLDFMRKRGIDVTLIEHDTKDGKPSGNGSIEDLADESFHVLPDAEENQRESTRPDSSVDALIITPTKCRLLSGNLRATAHVRWETDADKHILDIRSWYEDETRTEESCQPAVEGDTAQTAHEDGILYDCPSVGLSSAQVRIPQTWNEIKALPKDEQRIALFELKNALKTSKKIADHLSVSDSSVKSMMNALGVNEESLMEYLRSKMGLKK